MRNLTFHKLWFKGLGVMFAYSCVFKITHMPRVLAALIPVFGDSQIRYSILFGLVLLEAIMALRLLLLSADRLSAWTILLVLYLFTVYLVVLASKSSPPDCGCGDLISLAAKTRHAALFGILRNSILLAIHAALMHRKKLFNVESRPLVPLAQV